MLCKSLPTLSFRIFVNMYKFSSQHKRENPNQRRPWKLQETAKLKNPRQKKIIETCSIKEEGYNSMQASTLPAVLNLLMKPRHIGGSCSYTNTPSQHSAQLSTLTFQIMTTRRQIHQSDFSHFNDSEAWKSH